ncbi:hypothetical protein HK104_006080, partial [Borealophlyctis nickersoniae]
MSRSAPLILNKSNIAEYLNRDNTLTDKGKGLGYEQFPFLINYVTARKVNIAVAADRQAQMATAAAPSTSNTLTSGMTVTEARTLKAEAKM